MMLDRFSSERLNVIRFPLIVGVVFIHLGAGINPHSSASGFFTGIMLDLISNGVARVSVPLFFLMSGYFFFLGERCSVSEYRSKLKRRVNTLLIPFLFWNFLTLMVLFVAQAIPITKIYFSGANQVISSYGIVDFLNSILGFNKAPVSYQFWFIRDLLVMVLFSPILSLVFRSTVYIPVVVLVSLFTLWFFDFWPIYIPSISALFFFYLGGYLGQRKFSLFALDKFGKQATLFYVLVLLLDSLTKNILYNSQVHNFGVVLGVLTVLYLSKVVCLHETMKSALLKLSSYSFFVYALHEPMLTIIKKVLYRIIDPVSDLTVTVLYMLIPVIVILIAISVYRCVNLVMPKTLSFVCGGR